MNPTNRFRRVCRNAEAHIGTTEHGDDVYGPVYVLQQWWESQSVAEEYHEDGGVSIKLVSDGGEWRDVPTENETP